MKWWDAITQFFGTFLTTIESVAESLGVKAETVKTVEDDIVQVAEVVGKIVPLLGEVDAIVQPFLKSTKATTANATALAVIQHVSDVAQAVQSIHAAAPASSGTTTATASEIAPAQP